MEAASEAGAWPAMDNEAFVRMCRQRGTRCDAIMSLIEGGLSDAEIAMRYRDTSARDISVYRKALRGELCDLTEKAEDVKPIDRYRHIRARVRHTRLMIVDRQALRRLLREASGLGMESLSSRLGMRGGAIRDALYHGFMSIQTALIIRDEMGLDLLALGQLAYMGEENA